MRTSVLRSGGENRLVAAVTIDAGEFLLRIEGQTTGHQSRYTLQIGLDTHIEVAPSLELEGAFNQRVWRFMNHHCEPSAVIRGQDVYTVRRIQAGEEITFNYNTTELEIAEPFVCQCGSRSCNGTIRGFMHLSRSDQEELRLHLAPHLLGLLDSAAE